MQDYPTMGKLPLQTPPNGGVYFQGKMKKMFPVFEFIGAYISDLLVITKGNWSNHWKNMN